MKRIVITTLALTAVMLLAFAGSATAGNGNTGNGACNGNTKVTICHIPPGNPGNAHEITVSECALPAHIGPLGHANDFIGSCRQPQQNITCEQAVAAGLLTGEITGGNASVQNNVNQTFQVSLAVYKMFSNNTFDQQLFDSETKNVAAHSNQTYSVDLPACMYQIEIVCGPPKVPPEYGPFQVIDFEFGNVNQFCNMTAGNSTPGISAALNIQAFYPQNNSYSFECAASGFTPTAYHWYFGDASWLFFQSDNTKFHIYAPGSYHAACTATDGTNTATGTQDLVVS